MFQKVRFLWKNRKKAGCTKRSRGGTILAVMFFALILNFGAAAAHRNILQRGIAEEVLRFHVLANSDSDRDQKIKYMVRDAVLAWMQEEEAEESEMPGETGKKSISVEAEYAESEEKNVSEELKRKTPETADKQAVEDFLASHLSDIERIANDVLEAQDADYRARASLTTCYFPDRTYGDCTFPAGWYKALRISLGSGRGHNWWCVLYPALCFSDCLHAVVEEDGKEELKQVLSAEEYDSLLRSPEKWKISFRWF